MPDFDFDVFKKQWFVVAGEIPSSTTHGVLISEDGADYKLQYTEGGQVREDFQQRLYADRTTRTLNSSSGQERCISYWARPGKDCIFAMRRQSKNWIGPFLPFENKENADGSWGAEEEPPP